MKKGFGIKSCVAGLVLSLALPLVSCTAPKEAEGQKATVTVSSHKMLEGKPTETAVYRYTTDKAGAKIVIVGGTHGDEVAGWSTALDLVKEIPDIAGVRGEILLIPRVNILADNLQKRYAGEVNGVTYTDLNRAYPYPLGRADTATDLNRAYPYPLGRADTATAETIEIADAVIEVIASFVGEVLEEKERNLCLVDLHESRSESGDGGRLGSTLISVNDFFFMEDLMERYNTTYKGEGEKNFSHEEAVQDGSFSKYFSSLYPDSPVFTVETNRGRVNGVDTIPLSTRKRQQRNVLNALFDLLWDR